MPRVIAGQRLTFPFPFVHHQPPDWKVEQLLTMETRILIAEQAGFPFICTLVSTASPLVSFLMLGLDA